jgi:hypothetical protein
MTIYFCYLKLHVFRRDTNRFKFLIYSYDKISVGLLYDTVNNQTIQRHMVGWWTMTWKGFERKWLLPDPDNGWTMKTTKFLSRGCQCPSRDSNRVHSQYEASSVTATLSRFADTWSSPQVLEFEDNSICSFDSLNSMLIFKVWGLCSRLVRACGYGQRCRRFGGACCVCCEDWSVHFYLKLFIYAFYEPMTVTEQSKAWTVFARSNSEIKGLNPTQGIGICVRLLCLCCSVWM